MNGVETVTKKEKRDRILGLEVYISILYENYAVLGWYLIIKITVVINSKNKHNILKS